MILRSNSGWARHQYELACIESLMFSRKGREISTKVKLLYAFFSLGTSYDDHFYSSTVLFASRGMHDVRRF